MAIGSRSLRVGIFISLLLAAVIVAVPALAEGEYRLGVGDTLIISVFGFENEFNVGDVQITPDGKINYPIVGQLVAAGKTTTELSQEIAKGLSGMYKNPRVTVAVRRMASNTYAVFGEVRNPGIFELAPGTRVVDALAKAGGLNDIADNRVAKVVRKDSSVIEVDLQAILAGDSNKDVELQPGDKVMVSGAMVSIVGAVPHPGNLTFKEANNLAALIARSGGVSSNADIANAYIERKGKRSPLPLKELLLDKKEDANIALQPGDVIFVPISQLRVTVFGPVAKPGTVELVPGDKDKLIDAISFAGGAYPEARLDRVKVVRMMPDGQRKEMFLNLSKGAEANLQLANGDYIELTRKKQPLNISQLASFALSIFYLIKGIIE